MAVKYKELTAYKMRSRAANETEDPLSTLQLERKRVHEVFDPLWERGHMDRSRAYRWLAKRLKLHTYDCHVSSFDLRTCKQAIDICVRKRNQLFVEKPAPISNKNWDSARRKANAEFKRIVLTLSGGSDRVQS